MTMTGTAWDGIPLSDMGTKGGTRKMDGTPRKDDRKKDDTPQRGGTATTIVDMMPSTTTGLAGGGRS